jgi:hypothetical protein
MKTTKTDNLEEFEEELTDAMIAMGIMRSRKLNASDKLALRYFSAIPDDYNPSYRQIGIDLGMSKRTAMRTTQKLASLGLITVEQPTPCKPNVIDINRDAMLKFLYNTTNLFS